MATVVKRVDNHLLGQGSSRPVGLLRTFVECYAKEFGKQIVQTKSAEA